MKKRLLFTFSILLTLLLSLTSCNIFGNVFTNGTTVSSETDKSPTVVTDESGNAQTDTNGQTLTEAPSTDTSPSSDSGFDFTFSTKDTSTDYDTAGAVTAVFSASSIALKGSGATAEGTSLTINSEGTYIISGQCQSGSITVNVPVTAKVRLVLNGLELKNPMGAAIYVKSADKVFVTLAQGSVNTLSDGEKYDMVDGTVIIDAAVFSRVDISFNGLGTLNVNGLMAHGIVTKDDLVIGNGTYNITAAKSGIVGKDSVKIADGTISIECGSDGIKSNKSTNPIKGFVYIKNGKIQIKSGKEGLQAETLLRIDGGDINITAAGSPIQYATYQRNGGSVTANGITLK